MIAHLSLWIVAPAVWFLTGLLAACLVYQWVLWEERKK
jgi:hypothetical protein